MLADSAKRARNRLDTQARQPERFWLTARFEPPQCLFISRCFGLALRGIEPDSRCRSVKPNRESANLFPGCRGDIEVAGAFGKIDAWDGKRRRPAEDLPRLEP